MNGKTLNSIRESRMVSLVKRNALVALILFGIGAVVSPVAAQNFPSKSIRIVIPYGAGSSSTNFVPRLLADRMAADLGQPVVIENRPGGLGIPAINEVLNQPADGHTILAADASHWVINPTLQVVPYNFTRDLAPLTRTFNGALALTVSASSAIQSVQDLVAVAKAKPGSVNYASPGIGSLQQLQAEVLARGLGIKLTHIPYKSGSEVQEALLRGDVQIAFAGVNNVLPFLSTGKVKILAVSTKVRSKTLADVPTVAEVTGLQDFDWGTDQGLFVRTGTPKAVVDRLVASFTRAMSQPDVAAKVLESAVELKPTTPDQLAEILREDVKKYPQAIKLSGVKTD